MMAEVERQRHAQERGAIIKTLKEDFRRPMTTAKVLLGALDAQGISLSLEGLVFHLRYLGGQGFVEITEAQDMPGYRRDRPGSHKPESIMGAKLSPKGLQLLDGAIEEDPLVTF